MFRETYLIIEGLDSLKKEEEILTPFSGIFKYKSIIRSILISACSRVSFEYNERIKSTLLNVFNIYSQIS